MWQMDPLGESFNEKPLIVSPSHVIFCQPIEEPQENVRQSIEMFGEHGPDTSSRVPEELPVPEPVEISIDEDFQIGLAANMGPSDLPSGTPNGSIGDQSSEIGTPTGSVLNTVPDIGPIVGSMGNSTPGSFGAVQPLVSNPTAPTTTLENMGWPDAPGYGWASEKVYENEKWQTTFTFGSTKYKLGMTAEVTSFSNARAGESITPNRGSGRVEFTYQKWQDGVIVSEPQPVSINWEWNSANGSQPPLAASTFENGSPFTVSNPPAGETWTLIEVNESRTRLATGVFNGQALEYAYTTESRLNTKTEITPAVEPLNGTVDTTVRITGDYLNAFKAGDWTNNSNQARQGFLVADNNENGTFGRNQTVTTTYANGVAISNRVLEVGRKDGTHNTNTTLKVYYGEEVDNNNYLLGVVDRHTHSTGTVTERGQSNLTTTREGASMEWRVQDGRVADWAENKTRITTDQTKVREDFKRRTPVTTVPDGSTFTSDENGFNRFETTISAGQHDTKTTYDSVVAAGVVTTDVASDEAIFNRNDDGTAEGVNNYWRRDFWNNGFTSDTEGTATYKVTTSTDDKDKTKTTYNFHENLIVDTAEWLGTGIASRKLTNKGQTVNSDTQTTTNYDDKVDLSGPTRTSGNTRGEYRTNPIAATVVGGVAVTIVGDVTSESSAKLAGTVTSDINSYGPRQFNKSIKKRTEYGAEDNTQSVKINNLHSVNGVAQSGSIESKAVLRGKDSVERTQTGTLYWHGEPNNRLLRTQTSNLTWKWTGDVTAGTDARTVIFNGGVPTEHILQDDKSKAGYG
ncbi:MAG: hypothetical protein ACRCZF_18735, partial [Gemmataceae bacterium]